MSATTAGTTPEGPGSVAGAPNLPAGFADTFTSRYIDTGELRLHAVIGGDGPPLLLVHGWPETWYAWRLLMPALARDFQVIAVDQRGIGLSDKPADGYDTGTLAGDLVALMDALGHQRFAVVGHDTGFAISYALAADHPERVDRVGACRDPRAPRGGSLTAAVRSRAGQQQAVAHPVQPGREAARTAHQGPGGRLLRLRVRHPGREAGRRRRSTTTSACSPTRTSCAAASGSTERSTRPSRRTSSARRPARRCPFWQSAESEATANTSRTR